MSERYSKLFALPENLYAEGSPVVISAGALLKDNNTGNILAQLKIKNISDKTIKVAKVKVYPLDSLNNPIGEEIEYEYLDLAAARDIEFGQKNAITLPNASTRAFAVSVTEVGFTYNSVWSGTDNEWTSLSKPDSLEKSLGDTELVKQYKIKYGNSSKNVLTEEKDLWICSCGALNHVNERSCHICGRSFAEQKGFDLNELKEETNTRLEDERKAAKAAAEAAKEQAAAKAKKTKKIISVAVPVAVVLMIAAIIVSSAAKKSNAYKAAVELYNAKQYDEAVAAFEALGNYKDSKEQIENIGLEKKYDLALEEISQGNFDEAYKLFEELGDFKDSAEYLSHFQLESVILSESCERDGATYYSVEYTYDAGRLVAEDWTIPETTRFYGIHYVTATPGKYKVEYEYVKNSDSRTLTLFDGSGSTLCMIFYNYDKDGKLLEEMKSMKTSKGNGEYDKYEYDQNGNRILWLWYQNLDGSGEPYATYTYEYDDKNNTVRECYKYDWGLEKEEYENTYDSEGRIIEHKSLAENGSTYTYEYDSESNLIREQEYIPASDLETENNYEYDEYGNLVKETTYYTYYSNGKGSKVEQLNTYVTTYEYGIVYSLELD
jgi:YD repeat-containing protein